MRMLFFVFGVVLLLACHQNTLAPTSVSTNTTGTGITASAVVDSGTKRVKFIAIQLVNFDLPYLVYSKPRHQPIDVNALHVKAERALKLLEDVVMAGKLCKAFLNLLNSDII